MTLDKFKSSGILSSYARKTTLVSLMLADDDDGDDEDKGDKDKGKGKDEGGG